MNFQYKVRDQEGRVISATAAAPSREQVVRDLIEQGLQPLVIIPLRGSQLRSSQPGRRPKSILQRGWGKMVKEDEVLFFTRDLYTLVRAGMNIVPGIRDIAGQIPNIHFREALYDICDDVNAGSKFSEAFMKHPKIFSEFYCNSIRAGEHSGKLEEILSRLVLKLEQDLETRQIIKDAMRYPTIVLCFLAIAFTLVITFVVPKISSLFLQFNAELPLPTRMIIAVGNFSQHYGLFLLMGALAAVFLFQLYKRTPHGRVVWDTLKLYIPVFGTLHRKAALNEFASTLETLHSSGVVLPDAMKISARVVDNKAVSSGILKAYNMVVEGKPLSEALRRNNLFPPLMIRMISVGENSGNLDQMLDEVHKHYEREIRVMTKSLTVLIEPILTVAMGSMVAVFAFGVFLPMWKMISLMRGH